MEQREMTKENIRKNLQRPNNPYMVDYQFDGKRIRKSFKSEQEAMDYVANYNKAIKKSQALLWGKQLTPTQVYDITTALNLLPYGRTLTEAVKALLANSGLKENITVEKAVDEFLATKNEIAPKSLKTIEARIKKFLRDFSKWEMMGSASIREWIASKGKAKTIYHYHTLVKEFFSFCARREYYCENPMHRIHSSDFPRITKSSAEFFTVDETKGFFEFIKEKYPIYLEWFAIAFFTGIRREEINRLKPNMFNFETKEILLPSTITKTGDTWLMADLPDNLWKWITEGSKITKMTDDAFTRIMVAVKEATGIEWKHNTARHSFATYHLSLYRDSAKTSLLLRHRNRDTLWQHYLGGLTSKADAEAYFEI